jgi:uncharacterized protein (DUF1697 family)
VKYVALLRGINVGGNAVIRMADLRKLVEGCGFNDVRTFIQSGNILFSSDEKDPAAVSSRLESCLSGHLAHSGIIVLTHAGFRAVVAGAPPDWNSRKDLRCYIAFIKNPLTAGEVIKELKPKEGVDFVKAGPGAVYMSTLLSGITKTGFTKLIGTAAYQGITMRNYNTVRKLMSLMEAD